MRLKIFSLLLICLAAAFNSYAQSNNSQEKHKVFEHLKANIKQYGFAEDVVLNDTACKLTLKYSNREIEITVSKMMDKHPEWNKDNGQLILVMKSEPGQTAFRERHTDTADSYKYSKEFYLRFDSKKIKDNSAFTTEMENDFKSLIKLCH